MKKKIVALITVVLLGLSSISSFALNLDNYKQVMDNLTSHINTTLSKFQDISKNEWYVNTVAKLVALEGINGYSDGTFKPNNNMTQAEFIKTVVAVFDSPQVIPSKGHWATNYISRAEKLEFLDAGEYKEGDLDKPITRNQMARIAVRVASSRGETFLPNRADYIYQIKDYNAIPEDYRCPVLKAYSQGIIAGYPDGEFKGSQNLTRAEASTVIVRIFDEAERVLPKTPIASEIKNAGEVITNPEFFSSDYNIKYAQVLTSNPYDMELHKVQTATFIKVKGIGRLIIVQNNKLIQFINPYPNSDGYTYHALPDNINLSEIDYFGIADYYSDTLMLIPNQFK